MKVATVQFQHRAGDRSYNFDVIKTFVEQASAEDVELIVFPECCLTGYWHLRHLDRPEIYRLAEEVPDGPYCQRLWKLSKAKNMSLGVGLIERTVDGKLYNSFFVANSDGSYACHRKLHSFVSEHIDSGDQFTVFTGPGGKKFGILLCYDNNIIENVRATALLGADVLLAPHQTGGCNSGSPFAMGVIDRELWDNRHSNPDAIEREFRGGKGRDWLMRWLPSRAHDNGLFLIFSNGVGADDDEVRTGNAMVLDPYGRIINETWAAKDEMVVADLDFSLQERSTGARWIRARRPELYGSLVEQQGTAESTREIRFEHLRPQVS